MMFSLFTTAKKGKTNVHNWMLKNHPGRDCALSLWNDIARSYASIKIGGDVPRDICSDAKAVLRKCGVRF